MTEAACRGTACRKATKVSITALLELLPCPSLGCLQPSTAKRAPDAHDRRTAHSFAIFPRALIRVVLFTDWMCKKNPVQCRQANIINNMHATLSFPLAVLAEFSMCVLRISVTQAPHPRGALLNLRSVGSRRRLVSLVSSSSTDTFQNTNMSENQCALRACAHTQPPKPPSARSFSSQRPAHLDTEAMMLVISFFCVSGREPLAPGSGSNVATRR